MPISHLVGVGRPFDPQRKFVTSPLFSPAVLGAARLLIAVYTLITLIYLLVEFSRRGTAETFFSYFTELTQIGLCAYFWASGVQTVHYAYTNSQWYALQRWPRFLQFLHVLLHSTIVTYPILVTAVYWALLSSPSSFDNTFHAWNNTSMHILNAAYALFEIFFTNTPVLPWLLLVPGIVMLGGYLGVAYITHITQGLYPYSFLNPDKSGKLLAGYICGIAAAEIVIFIVVRYLIFFREKLAIKSGRLPPVEESSKRIASPESLGDWQDVERPSGQEP